MFTHGEAMEVEKSAMQRRPHFLAILILFIASACASQLAQEPNLWDEGRPRAIGIWDRGKTVLLFSVLTGCNEQYLHPQLLVSNDSGKTWAKSGQDLYGQELRFIFESGEEVMVGGQEYIEGPWRAPSLLVYREGAAEWQQFSIYDGDSQLKALAHDELRPNRFLAWVQYIDMMKYDDIDDGPIYLYQSLDRGRTWKAVRKVKSIPQSAPHLRFFVELPMEHGRWRISEAYQHRARLEHIEDNGQWSVIAGLPLPIQQTCPREPDADAAEKP